MAELDFSSRGTLLEEKGALDFSDQTVEAGKRPGLLREVGSQIGDALYYHLPGALGAALEGDEPFRTRDWKDAMVERSRQRSESVAAEPGARDPLGPFGLLSREDVRALGPSLAFSGVGAGAGVAAGVPAAVAGGALSGPAAPVVGPVAGFAAGGAASGRAAYNMAINQFLRDARRHADGQAMEARGVALSDEEWAAAEPNFMELGKEYGLWEAVPEAISNMVGAGILLSPAKRLVPKALKGIVGRNILTRGATKLGALEASELPSEAVTQMGQRNVEVEAGLAEPGAQPRSFKSPSDWWESVKEVAGPVALQTAIMGGAGGAAVGGYRALQSRKPSSMDAAREALRTAQEAAGPAPAPEAAPAPPQATAPLAGAREALQEVEAAQNRRPPPPPPAPPADPKAEALKSLERFARQGRGAAIVSPSPAANEFMRLLERARQAGATDEEIDEATRRGKETPVDVARSTAENLKAKAAAMAATAVKGAVDEIENADETAQARQDADARNAAQGDADEGTGGEEAQPGVLAGTVDDGAHEAAPSPINDLPEPTEGQKDAGNYQKGHVKIAGLNVSIENPVGSKRRPEWPTLESHYGYVKGVPARAPDKEHVDAFVKPGTTEGFAGEVYVVDQQKKDGAFDEPKVMVGFASEQEAREAYQRNYTPDWKGARDVTPMSMEQFKAKLQDPKAFLKPQRPEKWLDTTKGTEHDRENQEGLPSEIGGREKPVQAEPQQAAGGEATAPGGVLQAPQAEQPVAPPARLLPAERRARAAEEAAKRQAERTVAVPEADREILRTMAAESGWIEEGGKAVGARTAWEETALGIKSRREMTEAGMGRTKWIGKPEWAKGFGYSVPEMKAIVEKAIAGKPLGSKQRLAVQAMLDELREGERLTAEAEAVAEAASDIVVDHLADKWPTMAEDEKDAALDALFAGRPEAPAAKGEGAREAASEAEARREVPAEREPGEDDEVEREPVGRDGMRQEDRDRATLDSNVAEFDAQVREQDDVASTVLAGAKSWAKDNGLDDGAFRRALHKKWRDDKSQRMRDLAHAMLGPVSATESSEKAALDKLSDTEWRRAVDVPKAVLRALEDKGLVESQPYTTSELGGQGLEWRKVTPESKARKEAFERDIAARKERRAALAKRLAVDLDRDGGVRATMTNGHSLLLTKNISGTAPYRVTSFLKDGTPIGHTEYESINGRGLTGAVHEFMGEDTKFEGRPALDLTQQTEADLKAKEAQAATGKTEEQSAAVRDRDTAVLTPPEGTAPARDATEAKVPTQQEGLFGNAVAALRTAADELEKAAKSETEKPAPQTDLWRVSRDEIMKQEDGVRAKAHEHAVALALLRGEEVPDDAVPYQWRDSERDGFVKRARERGPLPAEIVGAETDIPLDTAERAFAGTSHVPERRGRNAVEEYVATIKADFDSLRAKADTEDKRATLNTMFAEYRGGYRSRYLAWLGAHSRVMSAMITGPAKFPTASNAKRSTSADRRYQELREFRKRALDRIVGEIAPQEARAISSDDPEAVAKLKEKLSAVEALQARMRAVNEAHRKFLKDPASLDASSLSDKDKERVRAYKPAYSWEPHPFAPYQLSNNNAEIKRLTERIASIEQRSADTTREQQFDGFKVVDSVESNRLQIFFPGKPDEATRSKLKANGFKWAPSEGAWQRFRGPGAETALERALGVKFEPKPATGEGTQDAGDKDVRFSRQADAINEYALERGTDKRGQPAFANQHIVIANAVPDPVSRGEGAQSYTWTIYDRTNPGEKGSRFRKVGTLYADLGPDGKFEKLRLIETYRRYRQKGLGYGESVLASMLASNGRGYRMGIQNIVHHVEPKDADALPFWRKMGVRLLNYATDPSVEINGDVSLEDYLRARGERSSFNRDANRGRTESLAEGTQGALAPEGQARARRDTRGDEPGADGRGDRGRQGVLGREPGSARGARAEVARRAASIREAVEPIIKAWGNAPEVVLIDSMADAPAAVRAQDEGQRSQGATGAPEAFIYRNKVYLVAEGIASPAAAVRALLHESVGHFGLRQVFGEQLDPVLDDVARSFAGRVRAKATEYGLDFENREQRRHAAEEVLAELAATMPRAGVVRRAIAAIREFLRSLGIDLDLSDNDIIVNFILPAREFVERSQIRGREAVPAAAFERERPWYYSALERSLRDLKQGAAPATQWKATIKALKGVSKDEIEWSGVNEWLDTRQGKVTKDEVMDFLAQNGVRVEETVLSNEARAKEGTGESDRLKVEIDALGYDVVDDRIDEVFGVRRRSDGALFSDSGFAERGADFGGYIEELPEGVREKVERLGQLLATAEEDEFSQTSSRPRYSQYTLPGGENYRELLLTLPTRGRYRAGVLGNGMFAVYDERAQQVKDAGEFIDIGDAEVTAEDMNAKERGKRPGEQFRSSHFDQANILAHVRFDERTDANGKRVLFIEEIQSDWAQKGKREGFKKRPDQVTDAEREAARQYFGVKGWDEMPQDQHTAYALEMLDKRAVPPAPFVGKTEAWVSLALKRMIRYAAEHGFDRVAWTTGAQQADRYDLSKHVSHINWNRLDDGSYSFQAYGKNYDDGGNPIIKQSGVKPEGIADFIGKEAAEKILNARGTRGSLSNLDLKIGGEGMRAFYDKIVPNVTNGILKKFGGGRVSEVTITMPAAESDPDAAVRLVAGRDVVDREQPGFDITPAMREAAGQGLPMFSRAAAATPDDARITLERSAMPSARELFEDLTHSDRKLNRVISKFNTPFHIAETHPEFKPVYREAQDYSLDVSRIVNEAADLAKDLLPRIEGMADFKKKTPSTGDVGAIADALYAGTLWGNGSPLEGRVWTDEELKQGKAIDNGVGLPAFKPLTEAQIELYRQALASVAHSVTEHSKALIWRLAKMRKIILDRGMSLEDMAESARRDADVELAEVKADFNTREDERTARMNAAEGAAVGEISKEGRQDADRVQKQVDELEAFKASVSDIETKTKGLVEHGYFPAMRFGKYAVNVDRARPNGTREELYFGRFETQVAANMAKRELQREFPGARVTSGVMNDDAHKLFQGLNLDALELFAEHLVDENGEKVSADPIMQQYFRVATTERSALKRQIHRKGTPGFSKDVPRALAQFTVSQATSASRSYHAAGMLEKVRGIKAGDLQAYATRYVRYLQDPQEEAAALRGFLANYYILGSIAFGAINMTQPVLMSAPYLTQYTGWAKSMAALGKAAVDLVGGRKNLTAEEADAYARAAKAGVVSPQEIHQIRAETRASMLGDSPLWQKLEGIAEAKGLHLPGKLLLRKAAFLWGSIYALTEQFNRGTTFIAAYRIARETGQGDAYEFARKAVDATQGVYLRTNRPEISRGPAGATIMTFKQFSIAYLELAKRLYDHDKKAFAVLMLTLIALAGAEGLPFAEDIEDLVDTIGQWLGYGTNSRKRIRHFATDLLGPDIADIMLHGFSAIPGVPLDVANRLGMHNLIPGSAILKASEPDKTRDITDLLGPAASIFKNAGLALEGLATGRPGETKLLLPKALQDLGKAVEMVETGAYKDTKGRRVMDVDAMDAAVKFVGFQPAKVARETRIIGQNYQDIALHKVMESAIAGKWARGLADGDEAEVEEARAQWRAWNEANPELRIAINRQQLRRRVKELQAAREGRLVKSAPREIRGEVARDLQR